MISRPNVTSGPVLADAQILVVDDEPKARRLLVDLFNRLGYQTRGAASGQKALEYLARRQFDLVILDLNMPEMDGCEVLKAGRPLAPDTVFIILTGHGTLDSAIVATRYGAFDYLLKPSPSQEIIRVVKAGLVERERRLRHRDPVVLLEQALSQLKYTGEQPGKATPPDRLLQASGIIVDTVKDVVIVRDQPVHLTSTEFDILTHFMRHPDRVVSCRELVFHLRGYELDERDARTFVRSHIRRLRHKIEQDPSEPCLIHTVRGKGYLFADETGNPSLPA